jgi:transposase
MSKRQGKKRVPRQKRISGREAIRRQGYRLLRKGLPKSRIASVLGVKRMTVYRWEQRQEKEGPRSWRDKCMPGRPPNLSRAQKERLLRILKEGPLARGYRTNLWTLKRVAEVIREEFGVRYSLPGVWSVLGDLGFSPQVPLGRALERNEKYIRYWLREVWPSLVQRAQRQKMTIVFMDESYQQKEPNVRRTWAPTGSRPVIHYSERRDKLSLISGVTPDGALYFEVHRDNIEGTQVNWFLEQLFEEIPGRIMVIWDNGTIHRSEEVKAFLWEHRDRLETYRLPPYAPEINPDEYIWNMLKYQRLANFCPTTVEEMEHVVNRELRRMKRQPERIRSGILHAKAMDILTPAEGNGVAT